MGTRAQRRRVVGDDNREEQVRHGVAVGEALRRILMKGNVKARALRRRRTWSTCCDSLRRVGKDTCRKARVRKRSFE